MDEMNLLAALRDEVPLAPPSPGAQRLFRAGLTADEAGNQEERGRLARSRRRRPAGLARGQLRWPRLAVAGVAAAGLTGALVAVLLPHSAATPPGQPAADPTASGTVMSAQLLADIAGQKVLQSEQAVKPTQWVYQKIETYSDPGPVNPKYKATQIQTQWVMADGTDMQWGPVDGRMIGGLILTGPHAAGDKKIMADAASAYENLSSLPKNPAALEAYYARRGDNKVYFENSRGQDYHPPTKAQLAAAEAEVAYVTMQNMLSSEVLPPSLTAELYHALADIPGIIAKKNVKDIAGQTGVEFILPQSEYSENLGTILSATTYQYLGQANWSGHPPYRLVKGQYTGSFDEEVLLDQALVPAPGKLPPA
jgi:hypothetical protein